MIKTLKGKITLIYLCLVITIGIVGGVSFYNLYKLESSIEGLMTDNYKSINAANNMLDVIEIQKRLMISYIYLPNEDKVNRFYEESNEFYKWFNTESNNVTESGEKESINKVKASYVKLIKAFSQLQVIEKPNNMEKALGYYDLNISNILLKLREEIRDVSIINENAMLKNKEKINKATQKSTNIVFSISVIFVITSFFLATFFVNKFLKPIYILRNAMRKVREGSLDQEAEIIFQDEIGDLAGEFNKVTKRLKQFEYSTLGRIMDEKNKSLSIVKTIYDPLIVLDTNYKVILLNNRCQKIFDIKEDSAIGKHFLQVIRNGEIYDYVLKVCEEDGKCDEYIVNINKEYYFNVTVTKIKDNYSRPNGVVVFLKDVTELKKLDEIKTDFISSISHEFKTPLTSIMIGTSLVLDKTIGDLTKKQEEILETIKEDSDKLADLVSNLLELSKVEYDKSIFTMKPCSIKDLVVEAIKNFQILANDKNINLKSIVEENLQMVNVDFEKIIWVINNLISNAIKFTEEGGEIFVEAYGKEDKIYVCVKDNGIGVDKKYIEKVFDKFTQIETKGYENKGSGLGLAIAKRIIEVHGGSIWCESSLGFGSKFIFTIPLSK